MQVTRSLTPPTQAMFPLSIGPNDIDGIKTIEVDNGSQLTLTVTADGQIIRTVFTGVPRFNINTGGYWQTVVISANKATILPTDAITIIAYDREVVPPLLPTFGPSAWGGGAVPNTLTNVNPGDQFQAWQVQQIIQWIEGTLTQQVAFPTFAYAAGIFYYQLGISGVIFQLFNSSSSQVILQIDETGDVQFYGRVQEKQGTNTASANDLTLPLNGNSCVITGSVQINRIGQANWQDGSVFRMLFLNAPLIKHFQATGGGFGFIWLNGQTDFQTRTNSTLTVEKINGAWFETGRSF